MRGDLLHVVLDEVGKGANTDWDHAACTGGEFDRMAIENED